MTNHGENIIPPVDPSDHANYSSYNKLVLTTYTVERLNEIGHAPTARCVYREDSPGCVIEGFQVGSSFVRVTEFRMWTDPATGEHIPASASPNGPPYDLIVQVGWLNQDESFHPQVGVSAKRNTVNYGKVTAYNEMGASVGPYPVDVVSAEDLIRVQERLRSISESDEQSVLSAPSDTAS